MRCCKCWRLGIPPTWLVLCGVILIQFGFGLYPVIVKKFASNNNTSPIIFSFYRDLGCVPILFLCVLIVERKVMFPQLKMMLVFLMLGFTGVFGNQLLYILGVYWAGPDAASAIQPITPVYTAILALLTCTEKLPSPHHVHTWFKLLGIILATGYCTIRIEFALPHCPWVSEAAGGAIELTITSADDDDYVPIPDAILPTDDGTNGTSAHMPHHVSKHLFGYMSLFGSTFLMACYIIIQKKFIFNQPKCIWRTHPIYVTAYSYMCGCALMGLCSLYYVATQQYHVFHIEDEAVYALIFAIFITSSTCYLLFSWTNMHISATVLTAFWPAQQYIGAVMLIVALFMTLFSNHMMERLEEGKPVLRVDCHMSMPSVVSRWDGEEFVFVKASNETTPLLSSLRQSNEVPLQATTRQFPLN